MYDNNTNDVSTFTQNRDKKSRLHLIFKWILILF